MREELRGGSADLGTVKEKLTGSHSVFCTLEVAKLRFSGERILLLKEVPGLRVFSLRPSRRTVYDWTKRGLLDRGGKLWLLETDGTGARLVTSEEAVLRFLERTRRR